MTAAPTLHGLPDATTAQLLAELAATTPRLPGAACRGHSDLYDAAATRMLGPAAMRQARAEALQLCRSCPMLTACRDWVDGLEPQRRPPGVIAGRIIPAKH